MAPGNSELTGYQFTVPDIHSMHVSPGWQCSTSLFSHWGFSGWRSQRLDHEHSALVRVRDELLARKEQEDLVLCAEDRGKDRGDGDEAERGGPCG